MDSPQKNLKGSARADRPSRATVWLLSFSVTAIVLGLGAVYGGSVALVHEISASRHDSSTVGTVRSSYRYYPNPELTKRHKDCTTFATYFVDGDEYEVQSSGGACPFDTGSKVAIRYSSADPAKASISHGGSRGATVVFLSGILTLGLGALGLLKLWRRSKTEQTPNLNTPPAS